MACGTQFSSVLAVYKASVQGGGSGGGKNIFLIRVYRCFDFMAFGEFGGLSLCWYSIGYGPCASKDKEPIPFFPFRLSTIFLVGRFIFRVN